MPTPREKFQELLKKLFQFDCAELDFGIYRIMNQKRAVIERFIEKDLLDGVAVELSSGALAQESELAERLADVTAQIKGVLGEEALDPEGNLDQQYHYTTIGKQYLELRERVGKAKSSPELEAEIFNHLYTFFSRYYDDGDFMSLRRYSKRDKYAIPYNGEEVHLHWANSDQYYIKTGENFTDYSYKHEGWSVRFKLRNADVEQNNAKGTKRFFIPRCDELAFDDAARTVTLPFEFRPLEADEEIRYGKGSKGEGENGAAGNGNAKEKGKKKNGQDGILADALASVTEAAKKHPSALAALMTAKREDADGNPVSLIEHHLRAYTRANTSDFFIHKDLKGFLDRELDFYLKNEVLNLDELEAGGEARAESWFQLLRTIKAIGHKIIAFVAQIENFQKRLFEKKKFVTEVHYCLTLDQVPDEFYPEIAANDAQRKEWVRLFMIDEIKGDLVTAGYTKPMKVAFLQANRNLVLDTAFFDESFTARLLAHYSDVDDKCDGILMHSENFQALALLQQRFRSQVQAVYIDPPYNAAATEILYKNEYKHSSWLALMNDRLRLTNSLLSNQGILCVTIDDYEFHRLRSLLEKLFQSENHLGTVVIRNNPSGRSTVKGFAINHEYALFYSKLSDQAVIGRLPHTEEQRSRYSETDKDGRHFEWENFRKNSSGSFRPDRPKQFYPIYCDPTTNSLRIPNLEWEVASNSWKVTEKPKGNEVSILPKDDFGRERVWRFGIERARREIGELLAKEKKGEHEIYKKKHLHDEGSLPRTWWDNPAYSARDNGTRSLVELFGSEKGFDFPKSVEAVKDCLKICVADAPALVMDYFGGSGTTAHAVIQLNREDDLGHKYVLVEAGAHFDGVLKARVQKVAYAAEWKGGKPSSRDTGASHMFKYIRLESYEDALDNITFETSDKQTALRLEDYVLSYMLDFETKQSDTLLNVAKLDAPFDYKLRRHGKDEPLPVDLPETFNYLIGLHVASRRVYENKGTRYLVYRGRAEGRETATLWRATRGWGQKEFEADKDFVEKHKLTQGAEDVFVNSDSFIPGARSLDPVFKRRMFNEE